MRLKIKNILYKWKYFWTVRHWFTNVPLFTFWKIFFGFSYFKDNETESYRFLKGGLRSVSLGFIYAAFILVVFEFLETTFPLNDIIKHTWLNYNVVFDNETISSFLTAVASISGVFLGLYFTAISSVSGTVLIGAPDKVRDLVLKDEESTQYISTLIMTSAVSVFYLVFKSIGAQVSFYSLLFLLILAVYNIFTFTRLGFSLFAISSSRTGSKISREVAKTLEGATDKFRNRNNPASQNHYSNRATHYINAFSDLVNFGIQKELFSIEQMQQLARYIGGILVTYIEKKKKIYSSSLWYKLLRKKKNWLLTDATEITVALNSGTSLSLDEVKDHQWFEKRWVNILDTLSSYFLTRKETEAVVLILEIYVQIFENQLAANLNPQDGDVYYKQIKKLFDQTLNEDLSVADRVTLIDSDGRIAIGDLLGFVNFLETITELKVKTVYSKDKIISGDIYTGDIPQAILANLERLVENVKNEYDSIGSYPTEEWYIQNYAAYFLQREIVKYFNHIKSLHESYYEKRISALVEAEHTLSAAQLTQRWIEFSNKFFMCLRMTEKALGILAQFNKQEDMQWENFDLESEVESAREYQKRATDSLVEQLPVLSAPENSHEDLPDYFGQSFTFGAEACYEACRENDFERFKRLLPSVFVGSWIAYGALNDETKNFSDDSRIVFSSEPLIDLIELSGYAKLYSELLQDQRYWNFCKALWDRYLEQENSANTIRLITATVSYRESLFMLMPKAILRANWENNFKHQLRENALPIDDDVTGPFGRNIVINHPSNLIKAMVRRGRLLSIDAEQVFFVTYLKKHPSAQGIDFPRDRYNLERRLEEMQNENENDE